MSVPPAADRRPEVLAADRRPEVLAADQRLEAFAADIRAGGEGAIFHRQPRGLWRRVAAMPWSWLVFPVIWWLLRRGLLRLALALGFVAAPVLAGLLLAFDAWSLWRARRRLNRLNPG